MAQKLLFTRTLAMGTAGIACAAYAALVLVTGRPDPMPVWIPGVLGAAAWIAISVMASRVSAKTRDATFDEGYRRDDQRAQQVGFWAGLWMYPLFGALLYGGAVDWPVAFAAMGTAMPAIYLISAVWFDMQGRL